jgi:hypothetical protein
MYIRALALLLFLAQVVLAEQPAPILPDPKLTRKVRAVPVWLKRRRTLADRSRENSRSATGRISRLQDSRMLLGLQILN